MHPLQKRFHDFIQENNLIEKGEETLLAVSGGLDSMVMLHLFIAAGFEVVVAHCNFGLRGEESDGDERLVVDYTRKAGIRCFVKKVSITEGSIQLQARTARYSWFESLKTEEGLGKIATAHHLDDSLETSLLNLVRGTGVSGLAGIPVKNKSIVRPLLFATKEELKQYAQEVKLEWREDSSNQKVDYQRNKLRHKVIPTLRELNPSLVQTYASTKARLAATRYFLTEKVDQIKEDFFNEELHEFDLSWISAEHDLLILSEVLAGYGFNYATVKDIFKAIGESGKVFPSNTGFSAYMDRSKLFLKQEEVTTTHLAVPSEGKYHSGGLVFDVVLKSANGVILDQGPDVAIFDSGELTFPLLIRSWKEGDRFQPLGMKGTKKVSDFLVDEKIPLAKKEEVLVVESGGQIAWVVGMRISSLFKVTGSTGPVLQITKSNL